MAETLDRLGAFTVIFFGVLVAVALLVGVAYVLMTLLWGEKRQSGRSDVAPRSTVEWQQAGVPWLPSGVSHRTDPEPFATPELSAALAPAPRRAAPLVVAPATPRQGAPLTITSCNDKGPRLRQGAPLRVTHNAPLWAEKGWRETPEGYDGMFQAAGRQWRGLIEVPYPEAYRALIWAPPLGALTGHPHRPCFRRNGHGPECYEVHYNEMPQSLDHAITTVEMVLADALTRRL